MTEALAVVLCGHGTRHADGADEFRAVARAVRDRLPQYEVVEAFLELAEPLLPVALVNLAAAGHRRIVVIPCMLFAAGHAKSDIPGMITRFRAKHPAVEVVYGRTFGVDTHLLTAARDIITRSLASLEAVGDGVTRAQTLLLVVGRGCSDLGANSDLVKVMRLLWEGLGFGWGEVGFFDVTFPHIEVALDHASRLGYRRILVLPYLLFNGVLVRRLHKIVAEAVRRYPDIGFVAAPYLNDHAGVIEVFVDRVKEAATLESGHDHGHNHDENEDDDEDHPHDHGAGHPFADHPNGPLSPRRWGI